MTDMLDPLKANMVPEEDETLEDGDVFTQKDEPEAAEVREPKLPDAFEDLPIEIRSLTERFVRCTFPTGSD